MSDPATRHWVDGESYDRYIGRWSRMVAGRFVDWLDVPPGVSWLDCGCGTGVLTRTILERAEPERVDAFDASPQFIERAAQTITDARASFHLADACALPSADASYDAVVSGLMLNLVRDRPRALAELARSAKAGGIVGVYLWDFEGVMQMTTYFWEEANAITPGADSERDAAGFELCHREALHAAFVAAGLREVETTAIDIETSFRDFDDYWQPLLRGSAPAQTHVLSLRDEQRAELRERLRARLPVSADGSIGLLARAWAAKGHVARRA